ncbi:lipid IV(A) 3-deoxy-D-manno-octulosonic acid transferase [Gilvimarinus polysaccharolyticus]|uniref:lipid IV(A) 3-deoxy-D-manno-octulosonic acid transferase n=1 Tax=Gilvimarinus polysaccharolyticus TaxID=863921 RepID=UPI000B32F87A|nr:lipid IV(A) 3-deoxy-D-manno-octulosonic acid transferase [Gilvimarinus polysaccharolyticus]
MAISYMRALYCLILYLLLPFILLRVFWRARHNRGHLKRLNERFGYVAPITGQRTRIWIHTVSVGEFLGALPLIRELLARQNTELIITCTTLTGSERIEQTLGGKVHHYYMPYDLPGALRRFIKIVDPDLLIIMETELWPNTLAACKARGVPTVLINARLSERSARGYRRIGGLTRAMLMRLSAAVVQHRADAERFIELGLAENRLTVSGNIKFDITFDAEQNELATRLKNAWSNSGPRLVWIAASTHNGEDEIVLQALQQLRDRGLSTEQLLLVLIPRHPERFDNVYNLCKKSGFTVVRRSADTTPTLATDILLGDTMGEQALMLGAADIVFMGGSLVDVGGHNFIEAAAWGQPLISGAALYNFAEVSRLLREAGALEIVKDAGEMAAAVQRLAEDEDLRSLVGAKAQAVAEENRGALARTREVIEKLL